MILRVDKIEIQQQPERKRFWADVEVTAPNGFRRKVITTPGEDGYWCMLQAIGEYLDGFLPKPAPVVVDTSGVPTAVTPEMLSGADSLDNPEYWNAATLGALRAEAEAAGVRVDGRWGVARLREEIASVGHGKAAHGV